MGQSFRCGWAATTRCLLLSSRQGFAEFRRPSAESEEISEESWTAKFLRKAETDFAGWHENVQTVVDERTKIVLFAGRSIAGRRS